MSRVLIAGCGDIGTALGRRLLADGHHVWGLRRSAAALPAGMHALRMDLTNPSALDDLPDGFDAAFYIVTPDAYEDAAYASAFVRGTENLLRALSSDGAEPGRLIFVSSTSVYGQSDGEWVDETSATDPGSFAGTRLLQGEEAVLGGPIPGTVVRFGGIYGRGEGRLVKRVRDGSPCQEAPPLYTNRIHCDDCVSVLHHLLNLDDPQRIYLGVDSEPAPQCAVMDWISAELGLPPSPRAAAVDDHPKGGKRCRNARLLATGYRFLYPSYRDGYGEVLKAARGT
jgi:nucleoside-diphosphate-sugar epimerase